MGNNTPVNGNNTNSVSNGADNYFTKSISYGGISGKSELYKGLGLIQLGNTEKGCKFLYLAKSRNFTEVNPDEQIKIYCK